MNNKKDNLIAVLQTGQRSCHNSSGLEIPCLNSGQDAEYHSGLTWPKPRFEVNDEIVMDQLTGLYWPRNASLAEFPLNWNDALKFVADLNKSNSLEYSDWRLPNRRELRSLIGHQTRSPSLPEAHPFHNVFANWYWSSTSA